MKSRNLWITFIAILVVCFSILGFFGHEIYRQKPPIPEKVVSEDGTTIFTKQQIEDGQNVWQSIGGQEIGTVWGHGAYVAPDWSADWLHKESVYLLDKWAEKDFSTSFNNLDPEKQAALKARLQEALRKNTYDSSMGSITVSNDIYSDQYNQRYCQDERHECFFLLGSLGMYYQQTWN
jgi:nitric oxide reductase subunit B